MLRVHHATAKVKGRWPMLELVCSMTSSHCESQRVTIQLSLVAIPRPPSFLLVRQCQACHALSLDTGRQGQRQVSVTFGQLPPSCYFGWGLERIPTPSSAFHSQSLSLQCTRGVLKEQLQCALLNRTKAVFNAKVVRFAKNKATLMAQVEHLAAPWQSIPSMSSMRSGLFSASFSDS